MKMVSELIKDGEIDFSDIFFIRNEFALKVIGDDWLGITMSNHENYFEKLRWLFFAELELNKEEKMKKTMEEFDELIKLLAEFED